jgi:hypothetical protein
VKHLAALVSLDARLLFKRALFRTVAVASVLGAAVAVLLSGGERGEGWWRLARAIQVVIPLLLSFGAILGAVSLAGDAATGSLRSVLTRPVSRTAVVCSRALVLALGIALVYAASILAALALSAVLDRFGPIRHEVYGTELVSREDLARAAAWLVAVALPALVCSALVGLMVSACWNDPSSSTICALLLVLTPYLLATVFDVSTPWVFTQRATVGAGVFLELAEGKLERLDILTDARALLRAIALPMGAGAAATAVGCAVFSSRDFRG